MYIVYMLGAAVQDVRGSILSLLQDVRGSILGLLATISDWLSLASRERLWPSG